MITVDKVLGLEKAVPKTILASESFSPLNKFHHLVNFGLHKLSIECIVCNFAT